MTGPTHKNHTFFHSTMSLLTSDLLERILDGLDSDLDRKTWRLVCRDFLRIESGHRKRIRILRPEFIPTLLTRYVNITHLDLSVCPRINDGTMSFLLTRHHRDFASWTRRLKVLVISGSAGLSWVGLEMLLRSCSGLQSVDVAHCFGFGDREASALTCARGLREVRLDRCQNLTDVGLVSLAVACCGLERLSLKWCLEITDLSVDLLVKKCCFLKSLDVSYLKITSESLRSIASLQKLEVLTMVGCPLVDDIGLEFIGNGCPSLQVINVSRCGGMTESGLISVMKGHEGLLQIKAGYSLLALSTHFLHGLNDFKRLQSLTVDGAHVSELGFKNFSINCKYLIEMGLSKCTGVTSDGIMQLVSGCVTLEILDLTCCSSVSDAAISAVAESCRKLVCLKLEACNLITEKSLARLGSCCLQLKEIDLTDCCGVDDRGLEYLSRCSELVILRLGLCTSISDKGLTYIASKCSELCELDLYRCNGIGDDGIVALSSGCKKIQKLNLSYCSKVSDRGMQHVALLEELSDLELRSLMNITSVGLTAVAAGCKRLAQLDLKSCENIDDSGFYALANYSWNLRQLTLCFCAISDLGLCMVMGNLTCLQDAKLISLRNVSVKGFELALKASCAWIKKVKLLAFLRLLISKELIQTLGARGCKVRWD